MKIEFNRIEVNRIGLIVGAMAWVVACLTASVPLHGADDDKSTPTAPETKTPPIAAVVNGSPIYVGEIQLSLAAVVKARRSNPKGLDHTKAEVMRDAIKRRLVEQALERDEAFVPKAALEKEMSRISTRMLAVGSTLEEYAAKRAVGVSALRQDMIWQIGWPRYLERRAVDALEGYFNEHRKDLDGTELRASHILLQATRPGETPVQNAAQAEKIREQITSGKLTFEQAAEKYSVGPSRRQGGDLGFFPRYGVMAEPFAKAAFELDSEEISEPINTPFGTHLIRITEVKPGKKQWTQVIPQIRNLVAVDLFDELAEAELEKAEIEFTGNVPYFKPGTTEIVVPGASAGK